MTAAPTNDQLLVEDEELIRAALFNAKLSRSFDKSTYAEGNIRERVVSISHGNDHRQRRRVENSIFRRERLQQFERDLFPVVVDELLPQLIEDGRADLLEVGEVLSVVLAARRAGIDYPDGDVAALRDLVKFVISFSQGSSILDTVGSTDHVRDEVRAALAHFDEHYFTPSYDRRVALLADGAAEDTSAETDVLTLLLRHRDEPGLNLDRDLIMRETATYLQGGTHTSGQTLVNFFSLFLPYVEQHPEALERVCTDRFFAQRCVQETIRIRPTTPRIKRLAEQDTMVGETPVPAGSVVVLDVYAANISPDPWGDDAAEFNPEREVPEGHQPWGLSFGAGPHICIGRTVAAGLPTVSGSVEDHLTGLVTSEIQAVARLGVEMDPEREAKRDDRTVRWTRWATFPVRFRNAPEGSR
jgi:cytochrome P450